MAVTTFATTAQVNARLGSGATDDATIIALILDGVTAQIARYCGRVIGGTNLMLRQSTYTEYLTGLGGNVLKLALYPVESITSVTVASDLDFTNGTLLTVNDNYRHRAENGLLFRVSENWERDEGCIKVIYVGGYVDPDSEATGVQIALPDDIVEACIQQSIHLYKRRNDYGVTGMRFDDGSITDIASGGLIKSVQDIVAPYRRMVI